MEKIYFEQVKLLLRVLPEFQKYPCFGLKGGTAINLFERDLPRLSVDLDFSYVLIEDRKNSLKKINQAVIEIAQKIENRLHEVHTSLRRTSEGNIYQVVVQQKFAAVKIDINHIIRGTIFPCRTATLCIKAQEEFGLFCEAKVVSFEDLYAGKICAALDRQHPRDFFDIKILLANEGLSEELLEAFVVYLVSHNRPMHELLSPNIHMLEQTFEREFNGMAFESVTYQELIDTAYVLIREIGKKLKDRHKKFLISFKSLEPEWELLKEPHISSLPAVKWKMINLQRLEEKKRLAQLGQLKNIL